MGDVHVKLVMMGLSAADVEMIFIVQHLTKNVQVFDMLIITQVLCNNKIIKLTINYYFACRAFILLEEGALKFRTYMIGILKKYLIGPKYTRRH